MTTPTNHHLTLMTIGGGRIEAQVVYLQPGAEWRPGHSVEVHIVCPEWLANIWYPARYSTGNQVFGGKYRYETSELVEEHHYLFRGTFERALTALPPA